MARQSTNLRGQPDPDDPRCALLYVIDSLDPGGAERSLVALAPAYVARGIELHVSYLHDRRFAATVTRLWILLFARGRRRATRIAEPSRSSTQAQARSRPYDSVRSRCRWQDRGPRSGRPVVSSLVKSATGPRCLPIPAFASGRCAEPSSWTGPLPARAKVPRHQPARRRRDGPPAEGHSRNRIDVVPRGRDPIQLGSRAPSAVAESVPSWASASTNPLCSCRCPARTAEGARRAARCPPRDHVVRPRHAASGRRSRRESNSTVASDGK